MPFDAASYIAGKNASGGGGGGDITVESLTVTENGTTTAPSGKAYSPVTVNVPNSYSAADEGKVVSNGALVAQTSDTVTQNGTVDTTLINSLTVNVSGGDPNENLSKFLNLTITNIEDATATRINSQRIAAIHTLVSVNLPSVTQIDTKGFYQDDNLETVNMHAVTWIQNEAFYGCNKLTALAFPALTTLQSAFKRCNLLASIDLGRPSSIPKYTFEYCPVFNVLILRKTSVCALDGIEAFTGTPFASDGTGGTIYIPKVLYDALGTGINDYKAATNWATIDGYGTITWAKIEGSQYENYYADGTPIPTT